MRYLVHINPPEEIAKKAEKYRESLIDIDARKPSADVHCSLMLIQCKEKKEKSIISELKRIRFEAFDATTDLLKMYGRSALAIKLKVNAKLYKLQQQINNRLKVYSDVEFSNFDESFDAHMTIARIKGTFEPKDKGFFAGETFPVMKFYLSKKDPKWRVIKTFYLNVDDN